MTSVQPRTTPAPAPPLPAADKLRRFLSAYWLRPENALWMTLRSDALDACAPAAGPLAAPGVDLGCGDGVFSFLHAGGRFDDSFDVFACVNHLDQITDRHADMFDCAAPTYDPLIAVSPRYTLAAGTDKKANLLAKAERLGLYERLVRHDHNQPLPFETGSFASVYCNTAYWVARIDAFLAEIRRITRPGGAIVLQVKLDGIKACTLDAHRPLLGDRFLNIIGRGRFETWPSMGDRRTWERRFSSAGLEIERATPIATRTHAHMWDIGLRPMAPLLVQMAAGLTAGNRQRIKTEWVELFGDLLEPFCRTDIDLVAGYGEPVEIQYLLRPGGDVPPR